MRPPSAIVFVYHTSFVLHNHRLLLNLLSVTCSVCRGSSCLVAIMRNGFKSDSPNLFLATISFATEKSLSLCSLPTTFLHRIQYTHSISLGDPQPVASSLSLIFTIHPLPSVGVGGGGGACAPAWTKKSKVVGPPQLQHLHCSVHERIHPTLCSCGLCERVSSNSSSFLLSVRGGIPRRRMSSSKNDACCGSNDTQRRTSPK